MKADHIGLLALLIIAAGAAHMSHRHLDRISVDGSLQQAETLPSIEALQLLSLGYEHVVADYYWLRALSHFGDDRMHEDAYPDLLPFVRRTLALDPDFLEAYSFAGTALTLNFFDPRHAVELLEVGVRRRPDVWRLSFLLGFNRYYFLGDFEGAADALSQAAQLPDAPENIAPLATRVAAHAGRPEVGLALIDSMLSSLEDDSLRPMYEERKKLLLIELEVRWLNEAIELFANREGRAPASLRDLLDVGMVPEMPRDPFGQPYYLSADGTVVSDTERLRLKREALPRAAGDPHEQ